MYWNMSPEECRYTLACEMIKLNDLFNVARSVGANLPEAYTREMRDVVNAYELMSRTVHAIQSVYNG